MQDFLTCVQPKHTQKGECTQPDKQQASAYWTLLLMMLELPRAVNELRRRHLVTDIQFITLETMLLIHITLLHYYVLFFFVGV
jgi:hypothetical protein